jgi:ubiquinone/menaquinone biosynthesis C-methylase UbiE
MPHIAFDRAACYYDATRALSAGVAEALRDAILAHTGAGPAARILELGAGTGRIALPFIQAGYNFTGVDLARPMLDQMAAKLSGAVGPTHPGAAGRAPSQPLLVQADVTRLPLPSRTYDVAFAVHVLHLVDGWQAAVREAQRVLRAPGGWLLIARDERADADDASSRALVDDQWHRILEHLGVDWRSLRPGLRAWDGERPDAILEAYLRGLGARTECFTLLDHREPLLSARAMVSRHVDRQYSSDWQLPDGVHAEAARRLQDWLESACPDPDILSGGMSRFRAVAAHW